MLHQKGPLRSKRTFYYIYLINNSAINTAPQAEAATSKRLRSNKAIITATINPNAADMGLEEA